MTKTEERTAEKELERDAKNQRTEEKNSAKRERDEKLSIISKAFGEKIDALRAEAHKERQKVWETWRERRSES